jgi:hypothetical protein
MNKDILQKQKAVRYCVAAGYVPYMETLVRYQPDVASSVSDISDVDVLGVKPASEIRSRKVVFDCKTLSKVSAVNRALWAAGLCKLIGADEAFVILNKAAPEGHRLAANQIGVRLFSEKLFDNFAGSASPDYLDGITYLDNPDAWKVVFELGTNQAQLAPLIFFLLNDAPLERSATVGLRTLLAKLKGAEGEFDAKKPAHLSVYGLVLAQILVFLAEMAYEFHNVFDPAMEKNHFSSMLENYVWGGREGFALRQKLHSALNAGKSQEDPQVFSLPGWEKFYELMRMMLDAPSLVGTAVLPVKEIAISHLCAPLALANANIDQRLGANKRARQFAMQTNRYLGSLSRLLKDCSDHYATMLSTTPIVKS